MAHCRIRPSSVSERGRLAASEHGVSSVRSLVSLLVLVLGACAVTPQVDVVRDPGAAFSRFATFMFHTPLHTDRSSGEGTVLSQRLRVLAERELTARGCKPVAAKCACSRPSNAKGWKKPPCCCPNGWPTGRPRQQLAWS